MNTEIVEISETEIKMVAGSGEIDPPAQIESDEYPQIINEPPP